MLNKIRVKIIHVKRELGVPYIPIIFSNFNKVGISLSMYSKMLLRYSAMKNMLNKIKIKLSSAVETQCCTKVFAIFLSCYGEIVL